MPTAYFKLYGEDLTRIARDLMLSDEPGKGASTSNSRTKPA